MALVSRFKLLNKIPSPFIRAKVLEELAKITSLIKQLDQGYVDPSIKTLTQRYFAYLEETCKDITVLTKRATWIHQFSVAVRIRLATYLNLTVRKDKTLQSPVNPDFIDDVETVINQLITLYTHHYISVGEHQRLISLLNDFRISASYIKPDITDPCYCELKEKLTELQAGYHLTLMCRLIPPPYETVDRQIRTLTREIETYLYPSSR